MNGISCLTELKIKLIGLGQTMNEIEPVTAILAEPSKPTNVTMTNQGRHPRSRIGKTARDRMNGHYPGAKNTKEPGTRGHLFGRSRRSWVKSTSRSLRALKK